LKNYFTKHFTEKNVSLVDLRSTVFNFFFVSELEANKLEYWSLPSLEFATDAGAHPSGALFRLPVLP